MIVSALKGAEKAIFCLFKLLKIYLTYKKLYVIHIIVTSDQV